MEAGEVADRRGAGPGLTMLTRSDSDCHEAAWRRAKTYAGEVVTAS
jgi:hypothetical protein